MSNGNFKQTSRLWNTSTSRSQERGSNQLRENSPCVYQQQMTDIPSMSGDACAGTTILQRLTVTKRDSPSSHFRESRTLQHHSRPKIRGPFSILPPPPCIASSSEGESWKPQLQKLEPEPEGDHYELKRNHLKKKALK